MTHQDKTHCDFCDKPFTRYDKEKGFYPEDRCRCHQKIMGMFNPPPVEGRCHICGTNKADRRSTYDCADLNRHDTAFPWCLECIAKYRIEQTIKAVKTMYDVLDEVEKKSGLDAYLRLDNTFLKNVDSRLPLEYA